jgi:type 1 glutamine amidotransferase
MRTLCLTLLVLPALVATSPGLVAGEKAAAGASKRLLLVTHSGGFIHDSVGVAEDVLKEVGPKHGFAVTCYRLTNPADPGITDRGKKDPQKALGDYSARFRQRTGKTVDAESTGKIDKETLKNFDVVLFFTTGNPMTPEQTKDLVEWVKAGGAFAGTHCATDTLYGDAAYGNLIGGYFSGHPAIQTIKVKVDDPKHPAAAAFEDGQDYRDEMYVFGLKGQFKEQPYGRKKVNVILSIAPGSFDLQKTAPRPDGDYAISWSREEGKGRVFYTSFGHRQEVWKDERFQKHLFGGLTWALGGGK